MAHKSHIIDDDGEVTIILQRPNATFAIWDNDIGGNELSSTQNNRDDNEAINGEYHIKVSARHLMFVSPVFQKTLYGGWKKGVTLVETGAAEIRVAVGILTPSFIFMNIIHSQFHAVPWEISLDMFAKVTVLTDYYQFLKALAVFKDIWFEYHRKCFSETYETQYYGCEYHELFASLPYSKRRICLRRQKVKTRLLIWNWQFQKQSLVRLTRSYIPAITLLIFASRFHQQGTEVCHCQRH